MKSAGESVAAGSVTGAQSVDRAMQLLRLVGDAGIDGASLAQLSAAMALPKPTCRRLLLSLVRAGMVEQTVHGHRYWLGAQLFALAKRSASGHVLDGSARDQVRALADECGETCFLSVRRGNFAVLLERFDAGEPITVSRAKPGDEFPLGVGAAPLAIIAAISEEEAERSLEANDDLIYRRFRRASVDGILAGRAEAQARGYSINRGMVFKDTWGLGAAVCNPGGRVVGAVSISTHGARLLSSQRQHQLGNALMQVAERISRRLPA